MTCIVEETLDDDKRRCRKQAKLIPWLRNKRTFQTNLRAILYLLELPHRALLLRKDKGKYFIQTTSYVESTSECITSHSWDVEVERNLISNTSFERIGRPQHKTPTKELKEAYPATYDAYEIKMNRNHVVCDICGCHGMPKYLK